MFAGRFSSSIGTVGVDFGAGVVKMLQLREHASGMDVVGAAASQIETDEQGKPDAQALAEQLRSAFAAGGFTGRRCVVSLPRQALHVQSIRLPQMPDHELREAIEWEASQRFGFDRAAMQADYLRTGAALQSGENREEIILLAASHASIHSHVDPLIAAGLRPIAIDAHFAALARMVGRRARRESDREQVRVVVEVGATGSLVMILRGDQIAFCKPINISGRMFTEAVADHLQMDAASAADLRATRIAAEANGAPGSNGARDDATDRAVFEAIRPLLGDLGKEVMLCLRYYGVTFRGKPPDRIALTGGDALEPRLDETLSQSCGIEVDARDSGDDLRKLPQQIHDKLNAPAGPLGGWAVAIGLSIRGLGRRKVEGAPVRVRRGAAA